MANNAHLPLCPLTGERCYGRACAWSVLLAGKGHACGIVAKGAVVIVDERQEAGMVGRVKCAGS